MALTGDGLVDFMRGLDGGTSAKQKQSKKSLEEMGFDEATFKEWIAKELQIEDKHTNAYSLWGPLLMANPSQQRLLWHLLEGIREGGHQRYLLLKNRRVGGSSAMEMLILSIAMMVRDISCGIISHTDHSAEKLFGSIKQAYARMSKTLRMSHPLLKNNANEMTWGNKDMRDVFEGNLGHQAHIECVSAGGRYPFSGGGVRILHMSECAKYDAIGDFAAQQRFILSCMGAVAQSGASLVLAESTPNGQQGWFYNEWMRNTRQDGDVKHVGGEKWKCLFISWLSDVACQAQVPHGYRWNRWHKDDEETETMLRETFKATEQQLFFRRNIINTRMQDNFDLFDQEYPTTPESAFLASGRPAVPRRYIKAAEASVIRDAAAYDPLFVEPYDGATSSTWEGDEELT